MKYSIVSFVLCVFTFLHLTVAHNVLLSPYRKSCFFEKLKKNDELAVSFQVGSRNAQEAEQLTADFWVISPQGQIVKTLENVAHGDISVRAVVDGRYQYCFSNEKSSEAQKDISFNVHGVVYVDVNDPEGDALDYAIRRLSQLTVDVKNEQSYLVVRERTHRNTAESTNSRVKWWSIFQLVIVAANSVFQIFFLRRFFEVKSGV
ncbi:hypothetical protein BABINDRAFT_173803 [Babjeviella inositovora NRRL Y-12698]|uniref:GOLD domain-containing protein n=1 Tax=Babjeviella inositovora NRRL Y-12698 TaxID=984486 RepID=A0A1E3QZL1_9ASCO|nr:uncharacterized protein BABINDRAFT_173803 [Babjeviella inositovora NRRL Y-12698]ODQ82984.1 hypothetical protein BABINDRAFT_173803 [Babjeviella inositovora NRRL Y-12698]